MGAIIQRIDNATRIAEFYIDDASDIAILPTTNTPGKDNLSTISGCAMGSIARIIAEEGKDYFYQLSGSGRWIRRSMPNCSGSSTSVIPEEYDDVLDYNSIDEFPETGKSGLLYIDASTNITYRWDGEKYVPLNCTLNIGETSNSAFRGDYGKVAYTHAIDNHKLSEPKSVGLYKISATKEGHIASLQSVTKSDITSLGIPDKDTTYSVATTTSDGLMSSTDKAKLDALVSGGTSSGGSSSVTSGVNTVKIGTTSYNPVNGVVSLPEYPNVPTKLSDLTNDLDLSETISDVLGEQEYDIKLISVKFDKDTAMTTHSIPDGTDYIQIDVKTKVDDNYSTTIDTRIFPRLKFASAPSGIINTERPAISVYYNHSICFRMCIDWKLNEFTHYAPIAAGTNDYYQVIAYVRK